MAGLVEVHAHKYADAATAEEDAGQFLPDGNLLTVMIEWIVPPHCFRTGRIIVLYVGSDPAVLDALILGPWSPACGPVGDRRGESA